MFTSHKMSGTQKINTGELTNKSCPHCYTVAVCSWGGKTQHSPPSVSAFSQCFICFRLFTGESKAQTDAVATVQWRLFAAAILGRTSRLMEHRCSQCSQLIGWSILVEGLQAQLLKHDARFSCDFISSVKNSDFSVRNTDRYVVSHLMGFLIFWMH